MALQSKWLAYANEEVAKGNAPKNEGAAFVGYYKKTGEIKVTPTVRNLLITGCVIVGLFAIALMGQSNTAKQSTTNCLSNGYTIEQCRCQEEVANQFESVFNYMPFVSSFFSPSQSDVQTAQRAISQSCGISFN